MEINLKLWRDEGDLLQDPTFYCKLVGSLIYLTITRQHISLVVHTISRFIQFPRHLYLSPVHRIIAPTEVKYHAMSVACSEIIWLHGLLSKLDFSQAKRTPLHANNTSAIQIATNLVYHERTKHIEVDCHSIRDAYDHRVITLPHVSTSVQLAEILTKSLTRQCHNFLVSKLMLLDLPALIWGGMSMKLISRY